MKGQSLDDIIGDREKLDDFFRKGSVIPVYTKAADLLYSKAKFDEDPEHYISGQLEAHKKCYDWASEKLLRENEDLTDAHVEEMGIQKSDQFRSEKMIKWDILWARINSEVYCWSRLTTFRSFLRTAVDSEKSVSETYAKAKARVDAGKYLFEQCLLEHEETLSEESFSRLEECIELAGRVSFVYSGLAGASKKRMAFAQRRYDEYFPAK